jgi:MFS family permease
MVIPMFRKAKVAYSVSLLLGAAGFISTYFIHDQYLLAVSFLLIGCAWAAMLALPFALLTNALSGKSLGSYMGLFNCTICLPQIVASLVGGVLFMTFGGKDVYLEVPVADEAKVEVVAEAEAPAAEAVEEVAVVEEAAEVAEAVEPVEEVVAEVVESTEEVVAEPEVKTELKKFQSGQIVMLVIAGISLLLGAIAVFGINTRRE